MTGSKGARAVSVATMLTVMVSCASVGGGGMGNFEARYFSARTALEDRDYATAIRSYRGMLDTAGPLETRLRLELAHALLRADRFPEAAQEASVVAAAHEDNRRAAALAVVGTAEHRMAQLAMSEGDFGPNTVAYLTRAQQALGQMLVYSEELDPLGSMARRKEMVDASLKNLGAL